MTNKDILSKAIASVTTLLAAFGSVAIKIQPPGSGIQEQLAFIVSFCGLLILLIISALADTLKLSFLRYVWIGLGVASLVVFFVLTLGYFDFKKQYTVPFPNEKSDSYIVGDILDKDGVKVKNYLQQKNLPITNWNLIAYGEGSDHITGIWTESSIENITQKLIRRYFYLMLFLTIGVFSLTEGALAKKDK